MAHRTTLLFDEETRKAAKELALRFDCSRSEAVRRAVVRQRDAELGITAEARHERVRALERLVTLFERNDPEEEVRRLKAEDEGF